MTRIELDFTNALADACGPHGIAEAELQALSEPSARALYAVLARRERDLRWIDLSARTDVDEILDFARSVEGRFRDVVVLGIGGSALGTRALDAALSSPVRPEAGGGRAPRLHVLDNVDPDQVGPFLESIDPTRTLFNVISKSGGTAETMSQFLLARALLIEALGEEGHRAHVVVTTGAEKGVLREIVRREGYRSFAVPEGVGGRFSVLSPVGLLPLALAGIDVRGVLAGAADMLARCQSPELFDNPALVYAALQHLMQSRRGAPMAVTFAYGQRLALLADWYAQLLAESLGKRVARDGSEVFRGPTPVRAVGVTDQHSQVQLYVEGPFDKWFTLLAVARPEHEVPIPSAYPDLEGAAYLGGHTLAELFAAERDGTRIALTEAGRPNVTITFPAVTPHAVGQYLQMMQMAVAVMGEHYDVNAFDQPGVEAGKVAAYALMGRAGYEARRAEIEAAGGRTRRSV